MLSVPAFGLSLVATYLVSLYVYRLFFHPLAKFPGPKIPAFTTWLEFYYDVMLRGQFIWQLEKWHQQYGPIIRISPEELHVCDPSFLDDIYGSQTRIRDKHSPWTAMSPTPGSMFLAISHETHRARRSAVSPFFSKKAVTNLEPLIQAKVNKLASRFRRACETGEIIRADAAFSALAMDIICQYTFGFDDDYLMENDFKLAWKECLVLSMESGALLRQFPWMGPVVKSLPRAFVAKTNPSLGLMNDWRDGVEARARIVIEGLDADTPKVRRNIFHELKDGNLPPKEKTIDRLTDEGFVLVGAGSETTGHTLSFIMYYVVSAPKIFERLRADLKTVLHNAEDTVPHTVIERLPYVAAVVFEGLRLSFGVVTRNPRVAPTEELAYKQWRIPAGTPVSSTGYFTLVNPEFFPEPFQFRPERWLEHENANPHKSPLLRYLVNFGQGTRQCLGMNLAYAELYLTVATIFRRFRMEMYETTIEDLIFKHDFFTAAPKLDSKGIRIKVVEELFD